MALYESVFIARQDVTQAQVDGFTEAFKKIISDQGGTVPKEESWGLRALAYKIKKNRKGYYVLMNIDAPAAAIHEMERQMRLNEDVLRYLSTRVDEFEEGPSAIMKAKERGDDRDRGHRSEGDGGYKKFDKPNASPAGETSEPVAAEPKAVEKKADDAAAPEEKAPEDKAGDTADDKAAGDKPEIEEDKGEAK
ncbi:MAG: 30S ribosomal protein S6 [Rhodospirillales bacterium]|nr:30S ribosomal protein S6 [Rhodospirillales bacterium]